MEPRHKPERPREEPHGGSPGVREVRGDLRSPARDRAERKPEGQPDEELIGGIGGDVTEVRESGLWLQETVESLRLTQAVGRLGGWSWDLATNRIERSQECCALHDVPPDALGSSLEAYLPYVHPEDRALMEDTGRAVLTGETPKIQYRFLHPDGRTMTFLAHAAIVAIDDDGKPTRVVGTVQDITELSDARSRAHQAALRFESFFEYAPSLSYMWRSCGDDFVLHAMNIAARNHDGDGGVEVLGTTAREFWADCPEVIEDLIRCANEHVCVTRRTRLEPGGPTVDLSYICAPPNTVVMQQQVVPDEALSAERLALYFQRVPSPAFLWRMIDGDFVLEGANEAGLAVSGGLVPRLFGARASELYGDRPDILEDLRRAAAGETLTRETTYTMISTGDEKEVVVTCVHLPPDAVAVHVRDVTEERSAQRQLLESRERERRSHEMMRALTQHLETVREAERAQVARDLHDDLGSMLSALKLEVELLARRNLEHAEDLLRLVDLVQRGIDAERQMIVRLRPEILDDLGLAAALEWLGEDIASRAGIECAFDLPSAATSIPEPVTTALFRIAQEALTNVMRHADATCVLVRLAAADDVRLEVIDDGRGFHPLSVPERRFGIVGMTERARALDGQVVVESAPGVGTTIRVTLPGY